MNTGNMPEDELDDLFRKSASEVHPEFDPEAWQAMEKKLDAYRARMAFWKKLGGLGALVLLLGISFWIGLQPIREKQNRQEITTAATETRSDPLPSREHPNKNSLNINKEKINGLKLDSGGDRNEIPAVAPAVAPRSNPEQETNVIRQKQPVLASRTNIALKKTNRPTAFITSQDKKPVKQSGETNPELNKNNQPNAIISPAPEQAKDQSEAASLVLPVAAAPPDSSAKNQDLRVLPVLSDSVKAVIPVAGPDSTKPKTRRNLLTLNRFAFSLLVAPDLSSVGFTNPGGISTNAGLLVSYYVTDKLSFSTGMVSARKIYAAKPADYKVDYWPGGYTPTNIAAVCGVLDVPVNIGFKVLQKEKFAFTVNTGLSSYFMRREKYDYDYGSHYGIKSYTVSNQNQHLFRIYNLSGSYSRQLSPGMALGVEPFVKVPLAGVGAGKVKLASAGVFFSLSYRYAK